MKTATYFYAALWLALLAPHTYGWWRALWLGLFAAVLYGLLWDGLRKEEQ